MRNQYDFIPDIHGQLDKLTALLLKLGYQPRGSTWKHSEQRQVVFLGDYVDRGPRVPDVLRLVRGMVEGGDAIAIMGNHEFNLVCWHTPDGEGGWLRAHSENYNRQNAVTRAAFEHRPSELHEWLEWMKRLPVALDLGGARAVHACWDAAAIRTMPPGCFEDPAFLKACAKAGTPERTRRERVLNGPELPLPEGRKFYDKEGNSHNKIRLRWWGRGQESRLGEVTMPMPMEEWLDIPLGSSADQFVNYSTAEPPVFFGHYWMPAHAEKKPTTKNLACLDYSAGLTGPLVAYRWNGERELTAGGYVMA
jgi:hypothetical protein